MHLLDLLQMVPGDVVVRPHGPGDSIETILMVYVPPWYVRPSI